MNLSGNKPPFEGLKISNGQRHVSGHGDGGRRASGADIILRWRDDGWARRPVLLPKLFRQCGSGESGPCVASRRCCRRARGRHAEADSVLQATGLRFAACSGLGRGAGSRAMRRLLCHGPQGQLSGLSPDARGVDFRSRPSRSSYPARASTW